MLSSRYNPCSRRDAIRLCCLRDTICLCCPRDATRLLCCRDTISCRVLVMQSVKCCLLLRCVCRSQVYDWSFTWFYIHWCIWINYWKRVGLLEYGVSMFILWCFARIASHALRLMLRCDWLTATFKLWSDWLVMKPSRGIHVNIVVFCNVVSFSFLCKMVAL